jgi:hypothetical protein
MQFNNGSSIFCLSGFSPTFGVGADLYISDYTITDSYLKLDHSYEHPQPVKMIHI